MGLGRASSPSGSCKLWGVQTKVLGQMGQRSAPGNAHSFAVFICSCFFIQGHCKSSYMVPRLPHVTTRRVLPPCPSELEPPRPLGQEMPPSGRCRSDATRQGSPPCPPSLNSAYPSASQLLASWYATPSFPHAPLLWVRGQLSAAPESSFGNFTHIQLSGSR